MTASTACRAVAPPPFGNGGNGWRYGYGVLGFNRWDLAVAAVVVAASTILTALAMGGPGRGARIVLVTPSGRRHFVTGRAGISVINAPGISGNSRIEMSPSGARFLDSPCPLGTCVAAGKVASPGDMAVCVPNGVAIYAEGEVEGESLDGVTF